MEDVLESLFERSLQGAVDTSPNRATRPVGAAEKAKMSIKFDKLMGGLKA